MRPITYAVLKWVSAIFLTTAALECNAAETDAYWHGVINNEWTVGIDSSTGLSNWYSKPPPNGTARDVPSGSATFAAGAKQFSVHVSADATIQKMVFTATAPHYSFLIHGQDRLYIKGDGIIDKGTVHPKFFVTGSVFISGPSTASDADFEVATPGTLSIKDSAGPATAPHRLSGGSVTTDGSVELGVNTFDLLRDFTQTSNGVLRLVLGKNSQGKLLADGDADLAGEIVVHGNPNSTVGEQTLIKAKSLSGTFTRSRFLDFPANLKKTLKYTKTEVILVLK